MKKRLSSLLILALVFTMLAPAFAFAAEAKVANDVVGTEFEEAVQTLGLLDILKGYPDGTFRPQNQITRAEFAAVVARSLGLEQAAQASNGDTKFSDTKGHWATGYITVASGAGIITGHTDGTFRPDEPVTYEQSVAMVVRALGYEPKAKQLGGYPIGHFNTANELKLLENIYQQDPKAPAPRGVVALVVNNALEAPIMVQNVYGDSNEFVVTDETLLTKYLGVTKLAGYKVVENFRTDKTLYKNEARVAKYDNNKGEYGAERRLQFADQFDPEYLIGLDVTAYVKNNNVFKLNVVSNTNHVYHDTVAEVSNAEISLQAADTTFDWDSNAKVYVNNIEVRGNSKTNIKEDVTYGRFVVERGKVTFAYLFDFADIAVVTTANEDEVKYANNSAVTSGKTIDLKKAKSFNVYNNDFSHASLEDIDVDSAIALWSKDDHYFVIVENESTEGQVNRIRKASITVEDEEFDFAKKAIFTDDEYATFKPYAEGSIDGLLGKDVKLVFDLNGDVLFVKASTEAKSATQYAVVLDGNRGNVEVYNQDGKTNSLDFADRRSEAAIMFSSVDSYRGNTAGFMLYQLNVDGDIVNSRGALVTTKGALSNSQQTIVVDKDKDGNTTGTIKSLKLEKINNSNVLVDGSDRYYFNSKTVFMNGLHSSGNYFAPHVLDTAEITRTSFKDVQAVIYFDQYRDVKFVLIVDNNFTPKSDNILYGVVTDDIGADINGLYVEIDVFGKGKEEYRLDNRTYVKKGDVVAFTIGSKGLVELTNYREFNVRAKANSFDYEVTFVNEEGDTTTADLRVTDSAVIYTQDANGKLTKTNRNAIKNFDYISFVFDHTDKRELIYAAVLSDAKAGGDTGVVTFNDGATIIVDNNVVFHSDRYTEIKNKLGRVIHVGSTTPIKLGDIVEIDGNTVTIKVTKAERDVDAAKEALTIRYSSNDSANSVTDDVYLDTTLSGHAVTISWHSDKPSVVATDGTVNRPSYTDGDAKVKLTATITHNVDGSVKATKEFTLVVKAKAADALEEALNAVNTAQSGVAMKNALDNHAGALGLQANYTGATNAEKQAIANYVFQHKPAKGYTQATLLDTIEEALE